MYIRLLRGSHNSLEIEQRSEKTNLGLRFIQVCLHFRLKVKVKNTAALELEETRFLR